MTDADIRIALGCDAVHPDRRGGQHVGMPCPGVRVTHNATGLTVFVDSERSQRANLAKATEDLRKMVAEYKGTP